jgi:hypothetical protein
VYLSQAGLAAAAELADARAELTAVVGDLAEAERRAEAHATEAGRAAARADAAEVALAEHKAEVRYAQYSAARTRRPWSHELLVISGSAWG